MLFKLLKQLLKEKNNQKIKNHYDLQVLKYQYSIRSVGWINTYTQITRFQILTQISQNLSNSSILDIGCGLGDLYKFLSSKYTNIKYSGIDLSPNMILLAKKNYPQINFICDDFLSYKFNQKFDYILASGTFNHKSQSQKFLEKNIKKINELSKKGFAINFLNKNFLNKSIKPQYKYYHPQKTLKMFKKIIPNKKISLIENYLENDFTIKTKSIE